MTRGKGLMMSEQNYSEMSDRELLWELVERDLLASSDGSLDWVEVGEVLERMRELGWNGSAWMSHDECGAFFVRAGSTYRLSAQADTLPRAVCEAALSATEQQEVSDG